MRVAQIIFHLVKLPDSPLGLCVIAEACEEQTVQLRSDRFVHLVASTLCQRFHPSGNTFRIAIRQAVEQTLQVAGNQDIHGRGNCGVEGTVPVIDTGAQKIRQHIVGIGRTDQLIYRQAHLHCIVGRQNIAKIPGRNYNIDLFTLIVHLTAGHQVAVSGEIIDNLRHQAAPVDGIRA